MWVADQVGHGATGKRVGLVDLCPLSFRDKGCRASQDSEEPPFPCQTANPRPVRVQGSSQGSPFLALLPFSLSPTSGRKEGCRWLLRTVRSASDICGEKGGWMCV
jgi:hypothetical protein